MRVGKKIASGVVAGCAVFVMGGLGVTASAKPVGPPPPTGSNAIDAASLALGATSLIVHDGIKIPCNILGGSIKGTSLGDFCVSDEK